MAILQAKHIIISPARLLENETAGEQDGWRTRPLENTLGIKVNYVMQYNTYTVECFTKCSRHGLCLRVKNNFEFSNSYVYLIMYL